jgi:hypothetical protein
MSPSLTQKCRSFAGRKPDTAKLNFKYQSASYA